MNKKDYKGTFFTTKQGYRCEVLRELKDGYWEIVFMDGNNFKTKCRDYTIRDKSVKNPFHPTCYNQGYIGCDRTIEYIWKIWSKMLERCYCDSYHKKNPTYIDCCVDNEWKNYKNFEKWFLEDSEYKEGFVLDKDIIVKGNKVYSKDTCCFVPPRVNSLFTKREKLRGDTPIGVSYRKDNQKYRARCYKLDGKIKNIGSFNTSKEAFYKYKEEKEKLIKLLAEMYKEDISEKVYQAMFRYEVEITD